MSPLVFDMFADIIAMRLIPSINSAALEVGAGALTLLSAPALKKFRKVALNLSFDKISDELKEVDMIMGNSNAINFPDETFDCVMSFSSIELDCYFWKTIATGRM